MRFITLSLAVCFAATLVVSAPTEDSTSKVIDAAASDSATNTSSTSSDSSTSTAGQNQARATAPGANMIDAHAHLANSTFTCLNRQVGYYADIESDCKVYHFCLLGDYNGQEVYQRVTYMCLNETTFDQRALDCVETSKMSTTCSESAKLYDESNAALRKAVAQSTMDAEKKAEEKAEEKKDEEKKDEEKKDEEKKDEEKKDEEKKAEEKEGEKKDDDKQE